MNILEQFPETMAWDDLRNRVIAAHCIFDEKAIGNSWKASSINIRVNDTIENISMETFFRLVTRCKVKTEQVSEYLNQLGFKTTLNAINAQLTHARKAEHRAKQPPAPAALHHVITTLPSIDDSPQLQPALPRICSPAEASKIIIAKVAKSYALSDEQAAQLPDYTTLLDALGKLSWAQSQHALTVSSAAREVTEGLSLFGISVPYNFQSAAHDEARRSIEMGLWILQLASNERLPHKPLGSGTPAEAYEYLLGRLVEFRHKGFHADDHFIANLNRKLKGEALVFRASPHHPVNGNTGRTNGLTELAKAGL